MDGIGILKAIISTGIVSIITILTVPSCLDSKQSPAMVEQDRYHGYMIVERVGRSARSYSVMVKKEPEKLVFSVTDLGIGGPFLAITAEYGGNANTVLLDLQVKRASKNGVVSSLEPENEDAKAILKQARMEIVRRENIRK